MAKLSERKILERRKRMQEEALRSVAKTEQLNIRMDEKNIYRLYAMAEKKVKPVGTMVREWIIDRLQQEEDMVPDKDPIKTLITSMSVLQDKMDKFEGLFQTTKSKKRNPLASDSWITKSKKHQI